MSKYQRLLSLTSLTSLDYLVIVVNTSFDAFLFLLLSLNFLCASLFVASVDLNLLSWFFPSLTTVTPAYQLHVPIQLGWIVNL